MPDFDNIRPLSATEIVSWDSKLELAVSHESPALLGEWYPITMRLENKELHSVTNIVVIVNLQASGDAANIEQSSKFKQIVVLSYSTLTLTKLLMYNIEHSSKFKQIIVLSYSTLTLTKLLMYNIEKSSKFKQIVVLSDSANSD